MYPDIALRVRLARVSQAFCMPAFSVMLGQGLTSAAVSPDPRAHQHAGAAFVHDAGGGGEGGAAATAKPGR